MPELHAAQAGSSRGFKMAARAAWVDRNLENARAIKGRIQSALTFLMQAEYSTSEVDTDAWGRGFRIERFVKISFSDARV